MHHLGIFGKIDNSGGGCRGHDDQCPERSFVLLAMASREFESQRDKKWAERSRRVEIDFRQRGTEAKKASGQFLGRGVNLTQI